MFLIKLTYCGFVSYQVMPNDDFEEESNTNGYVQVHGGDSKQLKQEASTTTSAPVAVKQESANKNDKDVVFRPKEASIF